MRRRFYFFPALLPLAEIVPWLLTAVGAVAGLAGFSGRAWWGKHRLMILALSAVFFTAAAIFVLAARPDGIVRDTGSQLIPPAQWPVPKVFQAAAAGVKSEQKPQFGDVWTRAVQKQILSAPVISGNLLIFGSYEGSVEALSLGDGKDAWLLPQKAPVFTLTSGDGGVVYAGEGLHQTASARLTAIRAGDGQVLWQREFLGHIEDSAALDTKNNRLWTGTGPGGLWALDTRAGDVLWHARIGHMDSKPLFQGSAVYALAQPDEKVQESYLYALNAESGNVRWKAVLPGQPWGSPVPDRTGKKLLMSTGIGQIGVTKPTDGGWAHAVSVADGETLWRKSLPGMAVQPDIYLSDADIIIYSLKTGDLVALNASDGATLWRARVGAELQSAAVLLEGAGEPLVAVTGFDGVFSILRALTGEEVARRVLSGSSTSSPVSAGDSVYAATAHSVTAFGGVHALREKH